MARAYAATIGLLNFVYVIIALHGTPVPWWEGWSLKLGVYVAAAAAILCNHSLDPMMAGLNAPTEFAARATFAGGIYGMVMATMAMGIPAHRGTRSIIFRAVAMVGRQWRRS